MKLFSRKTDPTAERARRSKAITARLEANPGVRRAPPAGAQIYLFENYLTPEDCGILMRLIDSNRRPSTLLAETADKEFRTSESCDLDRWDPDVRRIDERIAALLGLDPEYGETMQGQRYGPGQQFKAHYDWFHDTEEYWDAMMESGGQRTWTAMIYLNQVEEGGATWFPTAGIRIAPKPGLMLLWNNMEPDGTPNRQTLHEGMRVMKGTKYVITKWFRESHWLKTDFKSY
ncbi:2OG-Fe(II) oxygenase [Sphingomonas sp. LB-2]|uniref:2OG-Fe(II) oxygenase n=1 Tax=Sphingomonas caeni TaxID=2984949 RepID=UPI0022327FCA|nr:2OG-Fe(II) oxygenase [Sphingomonas caeni]MCW3849267.1 2OG-Fe(II) oxygenase [Sphingomonas caeni]